MARPPDPPADITPEIFSQFRSPRRGSGNPEQGTNPVWTWAIENKLTASSLNWAFDGPPSEEAGPCWSNSRYGQTKTLLPDGRVVRIGGEYEDWYDPDFYIYNDVIVTDASGCITIFGYSEEAFPPTDFHTATLAGDRIVIIGSLGYPAKRGNKVQVLAIDTSSYAVARIAPVGDAPPWLYEHTAELADDHTAIVVRGSLFRHSRWPTTVENVDEWRFDLATSSWSRLTACPWSRFAFLRADRKRNHLYWLRRLLRDQRRGKTDTAEERQQRRLSDLGESPRLDLLDTLYVPDVPHAEMSAGSERGVLRLSVEGVTVRYVEDSWDLQLTIEGTLQEDIIVRLCTDLRTKLAAIENSDIDCISLKLDTPTE